MTPTLADTLASGLVLGLLVWAGTDDVHLAVGLGAGLVAALRVPLATLELLRAVAELRRIR